jgi:hypothetical protein
MTTTCAARVTRAQRTSTGCCVHTGAAAPRIAARPARSPLGGVALPVRTRRAPTLVARAEPEAKGEPEVRARSRLRPSSPTMEADADAKWSHWEARPCARSYGRQGESVKGSDVLQLAGDRISLLGWRTFGRAANPPAQQSHAGGDRCTGSV